MFTFDFTYTITDFVMFDLDYVILNLDGNKLAYIETRGLQKIQNGESFMNVDLKSARSTGSDVYRMIGYSRLEEGIYHYYFLTIEYKSGNFWLVKYELTPEAGAISKLTSEILGSDPVDSIDIDDDYIVLGLSRAPDFGRIMIHEMDSLERVTVVEGDQAS